MRVAPVRDFFLQQERYVTNPSLMVQSFGELTRKVWNSRNFKVGWCKLKPLVSALDLKYAWHNRRNLLLVHVSGPPVF